MLKSFFLDSPFVIGEPRKHFPSRPYPDLNREIALLKMNKSENGKLEEAHRH
jgi:hypothetical protein